jgi:hypothetical protein
VVSPEDVSWRLQASSETDPLDELRKRNGQQWYNAQKRSLQQFLCDYINAQPNCAAGMNSSISTLGTNAIGGKILKVRWALPGHGKSGGLRLTVVALCAESAVVVAGAAIRREEPTDEDVRAAADRVTGK